MEMTICRDRWQLHLKTRGQHYHDEATKMEQLYAKHGNVGANVAALTLHALATLMERAREKRLTRNQHILFRLGEMIAYAETAASFANRAARAANKELNAKADTRFNAAALAGMSRIFAREASIKVAEEGMRWLCGVGGVTQNEITDFEKALNLTDIHLAQDGLINDMEFISNVIYDRVKA